MENEFEESFEKIYNDVYSKCSENLKAEKSSNNKILLIVLLILIVINVCIYPVFKSGIVSLFAFVISMIILITIHVIRNSQYKKMYKTEVITSLVKGYNDTYDYNAYGGILRSEYNMAKFDSMYYDEYFSEDQINGTLDSGENFKMSEVVTKKINRYRESDGSYRETEEVIFRGIFGKVDLKKEIPIKIHVSSNSAFRKFSKDRVEMDSAEFEKYYDCVTDDKVKLMQVFTSDLIEKYIAMIKNNKHSIELKVEDNLMFFRYGCQSVFEPPAFKDGLDKDFIKKYYKLIYYPLEIIKSTVEKMNEL